MTVSPVGWYMSSCKVIVWFSRLTALPYVTLFVTVTALKIGSRYRTGAVPGGMMFGQSHPAATITSTATRGNKRRRRIRSWSFPDRPGVKKFAVSALHPARPGTATAEKCRTVSSGKTVVRSQG